MSKSFFFNPKVMRPLCSGPLTQWLDSFAERLIQQGYSDLVGRRKMRLVADLSRWLGQQRLTAAKLNEQRVAEYLRGRWRRLVRKVGDKTTPLLLLRHLRQLGVVPAPTLPSGAMELLLRDYGQFLIRERGFAPGSVAHYVRMARSFLADRFPSGSIELRRLAAHDVTDFILCDTSGRGRRSAQLLAAVLRSFLTYLFQEGRTRINLALAVPSVAGWRLSELPRFLESAQVEQLLRSCDRRCKVGKRDYAMLLLFARLGLRVGEVAHLALTDIDWRAGELSIHGKGGRVDRPRTSGRRSWTICGKAALAAPPAWFSSKVKPPMWALLTRRLRSAASFVAPWHVPAFRAGTAAHMCCATRWPRGCSPTVVR